MVSSTVKKKFHIEEMDLSFDPHQLIKALVTVMIVLGAVAISNGGCIVEGESLNALKKVHTNQKLEFIS